MYYHFAIRWKKRFQLTTRKILRFELEQFEFGLRINTLSSEIRNQKSEIRTDIRTSLVMHADDFKKILIPYRYLVERLASEQRRGVQPSCVQVLMSPSVVDRRLIAKPFSKPRRV